MLKRVYIFISVFSMSALLMSCGAPKKDIEDQNNGVIEEERLDIMDNNTLTKDLLPSEDVAKADVIDVTEERAGINIKDLAAGVVVEAFLLEDISLGELFYALPIDDMVLVYNYGHGKLNIL